MSADMESLGILFELQWKKKPGGNNNRESVASIGIWDTPDASLDWMTFKSYVCQNLGTMEDIYVAYVDSDGDELPIESECEFKEALKFARQRASKGREVVLKVDKRGESLSSPHAPEPSQKVPSSKLMTDLERDLKRKYNKTSMKLTSKTKSGDKVQRVKHLSSGEVPATEEKKVEEHSLSNELGKKFACIMKLETDKRKKSKVEKDDSPPPWFKKYMQKFKSEIVAEVTSNVMYNTRQLLESTKTSSHASCCCGGKNGGPIAATKTKKKKISDEDSSDGALNSDQRDHKLLKKIEKLHKREKKLEKKLDSKLEKLENKTKRRMEKKIQYKTSSEQPSEKKTTAGTRKRVSDGPVGTYLMDAIPLNDGQKPAEIHIRLGEQFTKTWEIMNNGTLPWTDKTELRLAWGTSGLEPEATILKCPILMPGEKGIIAVTFRAPEFPGTFESYWHFYHMGVRFGHWLGCAVIVDSKDPEKEGANVTPAYNILPNQNELGKENENNKKDEVSKAKIDQPVDLRMNSAYKDKTPTNTLQRNEEYESDSDDENLSVISGTISLTSDSEEDENFVVVPMPPCFMCDVPLEKSDAAPVSEQQQSDKDETQSLPQNSSVPSPNTENEKKSDDPEADKKSAPETDKEASYQEPLTTRNKVYAVDMAGHCLPVGSPWAGNNGNTGAFTSDGNRSGTDTPPKEEETGGAKHFFSTHPQSRVGNGKAYGTAFTFSTNTNQTPPQGPFGGAQFKSDGKGHTFTYSTGPSRNKKQTSPPPPQGAKSTQDGEGQSHETSFGYSTSSSTDTKQTSPQDARGGAVHILPETLVNGAINVASQAFTTARAVLSNLRSRPSEEFGEWNWNETAADWLPRDRTTTENLKILMEMGFTNKILNVLLLQRYDNDIEKVVAELLTYKDNPGLIYSR